MSVLPPFSMNLENLPVLVPVPSSFPSLAPTMQLILGEDGVFEKVDGDASVGENGTENVSKAAISLAPSNGSIASSLVDINGSIAKITGAETGLQRAGGLQTRNSFRGPKPVSKRVNYPYGDAGDTAGAPAIGGSGGRPGGARTMKRGATTKIAAKATVSNAFRR